MKRIILGSASPRRRQLLAQIGIEFEVMVSEGEENYTSILPSEIVQELAQNKAANVAEKLRIIQGAIQDTLIIGADTIVVLDGKILGKPADEAEAFRMLKALQGQVHQVYTGVVLLIFDNDGKQRSSTGFVETSVYVHEMDEQEILDYIATKEPMDKAGSYGIQGSFAAYIDRIEGDYFNVVGLPLAYIYQQLKKESYLSRKE